jgi:hypothetical protein
MVFSLVTNLFDKEKQAASKSRRDYGKCHSHRLKTLSELRRNAMSELMFTYPDVKFLLNFNLPDFIAYTKSGGITIFGRFVDDKFPRLDPVSEEDSASNRNAAAKRYLEKIAVYNDSPFVDYENPEDQKRYGDWHSRLVDRDMMKRGYNSGECKNDDLLGCRIFLNRREIAKATVWNQKSNGYFSRSVYNDIIQDGKYCVNEGVNLVRIDFLFHCAWEIGQQDYTFGYVGKEKFDPSSKSSAYSAGMLQIADFMAAIESEFRIVPEDLKEYADGDDEDSKAIRRDFDFSN